MSTFKAAWRRFFWTMSFVAFLALVVYMARDMAHSQPVVFGVIVLSAIVGAVAFVYAIGNKEAMFIAVLAVAIHVFLDASYWSSVIDDISAQVAREQSAAASRDIVNEKRRARYEASASGKGAAQLTAEIEALKQDPRWTTSKQCIEATAPASRTYCQDYYRKVADLAAAKEAANLEQTVWNTSVETADLPRNLAKGALWVSDVTGMSVRAATNILVALMVCFIQAGLAFSLRIGWAPEKPREALQPAKAPEATETPAVATPAIYDAPAQDWASREDIAGLHKLLDDMRAANIGPNSGTNHTPDHVRDATKKVEQQFAETAKSPTLSNVENVPNHPESPVSSEASGEIIPLALAGDEPDVIEAVMTKEAANVYDLLTGMPKPMPLEHAFGADVKIRREKKTHGIGSAIKWFEACCEMNEDEDIETTMHQMWPSYERWCDMNKLHKLSSKQLSRDLGAHLKIPAGRKNGKRLAKGKVFRGLIVHMPAAEKVKRIAAA